ncbi:hypothetical protein [Labrenzia sp. THAF82]|uniref:hypothetical protein n=1 Tax=Labrenzia sp. THAF82 TaxID=2587861 RepID=UPI00126893FC|nr:hypothetical protein [Labrenzia sp. THAF82]
MITKPPGKALFEVLAPPYGLKPSDLGEEFEDRGERFRIIVLEPRRPKYPVNVERLSNRKKYKFSADSIAILLAKAQQRK